MWRRHEEEREREGTRARESSGVDLCPRAAREVMPFSFLVLRDLDLEDLLSFLKTWSKCASGQLATSFEFFHSRKCSTGGFSPLEISFLFLLSIALSAQLYLDDQHNRPNAIFF